MEILMKQNDLLESCHSREGGNPWQRVWIPAFAGMTNG